MLSILVILAACVSWLLLSKLFPIIGKLFTKCVTKTIEDVFVEEKKDE
jgi:uncharacterized membrane protein